MGVALLDAGPGPAIDSRPTVLPEQLIIEAERLRFPVLVLPDRTSFNEVISAVLAVVLAEYGAEPGGAEVIRERLTGVALTGGGLVLQGYSLGVAAP